MVSPGPGWNKEQSDPLQHSLEFCLDSQFVLVLEMGQLYWIHLWFPQSRSKLWQKPLGGFVCVFWPQVVGKSQTALGKVDGNVVNSSFIPYIYTVFFNQVASPQVLSYLYALVPGFLVSDSCDLSCLQVEQDPGPVALQVPQQLWTGEAMKERLASRPKRQQTAVLPRNVFDVLVYSYEAPASPPVSTSSDKLYSILSATSTSLVLERSSRTFFQVTYRKINSIRMYFHI